MIVKNGFYTKKTLIFVIVLLFFMAVNCSQKSKNKINDKESITVTGTQAVHSPYIKVEGEIKKENRE